MTQLLAHLQSRLSREEGQTMAEYGVVLGVLTLGAVGAFTFLGGHIDEVIRAVAGRF
jgi:Flp pilus assembly pilin Flp